MHRKLRFTQFLHYLLGLPVFLSLVPACFSLAAPLPANAPSDSQPNQTPLQLFDGYLIVIDGSIGKLHSLKFALDTGATRTIVSPQIAEALGLPRHSARTFNLDKIVPIESIELPEISFGSQQAFHLEALVSELNYLRACGTRVDALLGLDLLARTNLRINFREKRITFGEAAQDLLAVPMRSDSLTLQIDLEIDGRTAPVILDSGMSRILFYQDRLDALPTTYSLVGVSLGHATGGALPSREAIAPPLRIGSLILDRRVHLLPSAGPSSPENSTGYLGLSTLGVREIELDFTNHQFRWQK